VVTVNVNGMTQRVEWAKIYSSKAMLCLKVGHKVLTFLYVVFM
jgi:hypothetical protein